MAVGDGDWDACSQALLKLSLHSRVLQEFIYLLLDLPFGNVCLNFLGELLHFRRGTVFV